MGFGSLLSDIAANSSIQYPKVASLCRKIALRYLKANDTEFGLDGLVWSSDRDRALAVADRINCGIQKPCASFLAQSWPRAG